MARFAHSPVFRQALAGLWAALFTLAWAALAQAAPPRVLIVFGKHVSADARDAVHDAVGAQAQVLDASDYERQARAKGLLLYSEAALARLAPRQGALLIIVVTKSGARLTLTYRDGDTGTVLRKDSIPERARRAARARFEARLDASVRKALASFAADSGSSPAADREREGERERVEAPPNFPEPEPEPDAEPPQPFSERDDEQEPEPEPAAADSFKFALSAGLGAAMRQAIVPTRLGVHELDSGLFFSFALGLSMTMPVSSQFFLRASADYRSSLGLQGSETRGATEMSTGLRSHAVGFGVAPGYHFAAADSVSVFLHVGWYFRGLRPIAQLALPELSWHAAVFRPELNIPLAGELLTLRVAAEVLIIAGLYTTLPDESGLAHTGLGWGGEASLDLRLTSLASLRLDYRESHANFSTAWAQSLSDLERFVVLRAVLRY